MNGRPIDFDRALELVKHVYGFLEGAGVSGTIYLGDRLGLYRALADAGPITAADLAQRTGYDERWLLEWLRGQAAAGLVEHLGSERFEMTPEQAAILADEESSVLFSAGAFTGFPQQMQAFDRLPEVFRTGRGYTFDEQGAEANHAVARMFAPWFRHMLVPVVLPGLEGVVEKLEAGASVADVGCGAGVALIEMAKAFPNSQFHGYDISHHALALAEENKRRAGVDNVTFHHVAGEELPSDGRFQLVTSFDCIHDMTHPKEVMAQVRKSLSEDGTYLIADVKAHPTLEENIERNPMVSMMYAFSLMSCLASATSEPDGAALGNLGFTEHVARGYAEDAGFGDFRVHDFGHPVNVYYELRP